MAKQPDQDVLSELRKHAEAKLAGDDGKLLAASGEDLARIVHELRTHQIELQLQNEQLRHAQEELAGIRDRFVDLYDFAPVGYATVGGKGLIRQANLRLADMLGVPRAQLVGRPLSAFVVAEDADAYGACRRNVSASDTPTNGELRMKGPDGSVFWAAIECVACQSGDDPDAAFRCSISNRTSAHETQEELAEIFNLSLDLICIADIYESTFLKVNPAFTEVLGYKEAELVNHPFSEFIHPDDIAPTRRVVEDELQQGRKVLSFANRYRRKDGTWCWLEWASHPLPERGITFAVAHDVTEDRKAQAELCAERDRAQRYLSIAPAIIISLNRQGIVTLLNESGGTILECDPVQAVGKDWFETFVPDRLRDELRAVFARLMAGDEESVIDYENIVLTGAGCERLISWHNTLLRDDRGTIIGVLSSGRDITETKRLEERLRQTEKMQAIGQLAGGVAHDFNNQLAGIMNYADLLLSKTDDADLRPFIDGIIRLAARSGELTNQLLAFAHKGKYENVPVNVHSTIGEIVSILSHTLDRRIAMRQVLKAAPPTAAGDPTQLQNALLNLSLNARDAMPEGGELLFATDTIALDAEFCAQSAFDIVPGDYLRVEVADSGTGMTADTLSHMFEPFFTTKPQGKGTGMGLASVYGTVVNHHGAIEVTSEAGKGTTVTLYLPLSRDDARTQDAATGASATAAGSARILLVDDERSVRESTAALLRDKGYKVVTCEDGLKAVEYYRKSWQHIDLVILDMNMPVMNGRAAFVAMREVNPDIKAMLATGYSLDGDVQEILDEGVLLHIQKPFRIRNLVAQIETALDG